MRWQLVFECERQLALGEGEASEPVKPAAGEVNVVLRIAFSAQRIKAS